MNGLQRSRAFVLQFRTDADFDTGRVAGRIEHISSGWTSGFESVDELLALLGRALKERANDATAHHEPIDRSDS